MIHNSIKLQYVFERLKSKDLEIGGFLNVGAGSGDDISFFREFFPKMTTLLIDMDSRFVPDWKKLQKSFDNLKYVVCGATSRDGTGQFSKTNDVGGVLVEGTLADNEMYTVDFRTLDALVKEHNIPGPYFLKLDTHGVELDVLAGAREVLKNTQLIMMEVYNFKLQFLNETNLTFDEMSLHMKSLGFRCVDICDVLWRPGDLNLWQFHMIFIRDDHVSWDKKNFDHLDGMAYDSLVPSLSNKKKKPIKNRNWKKTIVRAGYAIRRRLRLLIIKFIKLTPNPIIQIVPKRLRLFFNRVILGERR